MPIHILEPSTITQRELARLTGLLNQRSHLQQQITKQAAEIFARIATGAAVEPGSLDAEIIEEFHGGRLTRLLTINGRPAK